MVFECSSQAIFLYICNLEKDYGLNCWSREYFLVFICKSVGSYGLGYTFSLRTVFLCEINTLVLS